MSAKSVDIQASSGWCGEEVKRREPPQVSSSSLGHDSNLRVALLRILASPCVQSWFGASNYTWRQSGFEPLESHALHDAKVHVTPLYVS
ncbi:hypothetical protein TNCV_1171971 [Trichonephila clavipes]|uniref:Uncharacterized protein n=1 Tax=Trichonephila clavipes TaxID=2585209 RepID=A0A8X6S5G1_TRICX|nr:hypothetical protein TNCV_1171971 [Trichonephila clavipes]